MLFRSLETNLGAVPLYCIYALVTSRITERLKKRGKVGFTERLAELNAVPLFRGRAAVIGDAVPIYTYDTKTDGGSDGSENGLK